MLRHVPRTPATRLLRGGGRRASALVGAAAAAAAGGASVALAEGIIDTEARAKVAKDLSQHVAASRASGISLMEVREGEGEVAAEGTWATVHYTVRLVGDGTVIDETRNSGCGDRDYGRPYEFAVGCMADASVLRALHACVLDMRVGGVRRVRTSLKDPAFGYLKVPPRIWEERHGKTWERELKPDWLIDVEVSLESVSRERPAGLVTRAFRELRGMLPGRAS